METIFVVDDEAGVRSMVRDALESTGYHVLDAGGGEEALALEETYTQPIHLLLTDIVMPGLSGPQLAQKFAARRPQARVLYMSAFSLVDALHHSIYVEPGVPILAKPFTVDALAQKVRQLLSVSAFARRPGNERADPTAQRAAR